MTAASDAVRTASPEVEPARRTRPYLVLGICCMSLLLVSMDISVLNVALPSLRRDFGASVTELQWTLDAYTLTIAGLLLLSGSTADRLGRRRTFLFGLGVFVIGSLLCSTAGSIGWLIAFRLIQAIGGSMLNPVAMSIVTATFRDPTARARATGIWSGVAGVSLALGPIVGGALTQTVGWRSVFWINVPLGIAAIVLTLMFVPESRSARPRRFDPVGQLLVIVLLVSVVGGLIEGPRVGWTSWVELLLATAAVAAITGLIAYERRRADPVIDVRFFRSFPFSAAVVTAILAFSSNGAFLFIATLYLQDVRGLSPLAAGLHMIPTAVMQILFAPISGRLVGAIGTRIPLLLAAAGLGTGAVLLTTVTTTTSDLSLAVVFAVIGIGQGLVNAPIANTALSGMPLSRAGSAAGIASTSRQTGAALGVALAGSLVGAAGAQSGVVFLSAVQPMWWIVLGFAVVIAALAIVSGSGWGRRSALAVAPLLVDEPEPGSAV
jgi:EmrB/QacA subfamily drug resistance transporter